MEDRIAPRGPRVRPLELVRRPEDEEPGFEGEFVDTLHSNHDDGFEQTVFLGTVGL